MISTETDLLRAGCAIQWCPPGGRRKGAPRRMELFGGMSQNGKKGSLFRAKLGPLTFDSDAGRRKGGTWIPSIPASVAFKEKTAKFRKKKTRNAIYSNLNTWTNAESIPRRRLRGGAAPTGPPAHAFQGHGESRAGG